MNETEHVSPSILAAVHLADRAGAKSVSSYKFEADGSVKWYAVAEYVGAIIRGSGDTVDDAFDALASRLLTNALCRCGKTVQTDGLGDGCNWTRKGIYWHSNCRAEPVTVSGDRGDVAAIRRAYDGLGRRARRSGGSASDMPAETN